LSGIWVYKKIKDAATKSITYEYARLIESTGEVQDTLIKYVFQCLDALSIKFGPAHAEVIICADGPCLVETGARLHGVKGPKMTELATGIGTHELVVDVALNGARLFKELHARDYRYVVKKWVFETMMHNKGTEGILTTSLDMPQLRQLPSIMDVFPSVHPGQELSITRDLATSPGIILQVHASLQQCFDDISVLRALEDSVLFQVLPPHPSVPCLPSVDMSKQGRASPMRIACQTSPYTMSHEELPPATLAEVGNPQGEEFFLSGMMKEA